jgi:hypothetical protein
MATPGTAEQARERDVESGDAEQRLSAGYLKQFASAGAKSSSGL